MKTLFVIAAFAAGQMAFAQETQDFKELKRIAIGGDLQVNMIKDSYNRLVVSEGSEMDKVEYENGTLHIEGDGIATLYYKDGLESLTIGSDIKFAANDEITGKTFTMNAGSDSQVSVNLNVADLRLTAGSDAQIKLKGKSTNVKFTLGSDVQLDAKDLNSQDVAVTMASDAQVSITAKGMVNAVVGSDGRLTIYGNPKNVRETKGSDAEITIVK